MKTSLYFNPFFIILTLIILCSSCSYDKNEKHYIAHACSAIDGYRYTNCQEALDNAIAKGMTYIEIDLDLTSDGYLVATHGWDMFHSMVGDTDSASGPVSYVDFQRARYYGKYTPITYEYILKKWDEYPELVLVTDKISNPEVIESFLSPLKHRMIVECFTLEDYTKIKQFGYKLPLYSGWPLTWKSLIKKGLRDCCHFRYSPLPDKYVFSGTADDATTKYSSRIGKQYAIYDADKVVTMAEADSIFSKDKRIKYVYIDMLER